MNIISKIKTKKNHNLFSEKIIESIYFQKNESLIELIESKTFLDFLIHQRIPGLLFFLYSQKKIKLETHLKNEYFKFYQNNKIRNIILIEYIKKLSETFDGQIFFFKGFPLILDVYPDIAIRHLYDIDIWTCKKNKLNVSNFLKENNWVEISSNRFKYDAYFIDLHTSILNADRIPARHNIISELEEIIKKDNLFHVKNQEIKILSIHPQYHIIILMLHFLKHNFAHYTSLLDICYLLKKYESFFLNEDYIIKIRELGFGELFYFIIKNFLKETLIYNYIHEKKNCFYKMYFQKKPN